VESAVPSVRLWKQKTLAAASGRKPAGFLFQCCALYGCYMHREKYSLTIFR